MEAYLQQLLVQSLALTAIVIVLMTFIESLALVGLLLPGTVMMTAIGVLIGNGKIDLYLAWGSSVIGCLLGDWASYVIGRAFREPLHRWPPLNRHSTMLGKIQYALYRHSFITILIGRFIGPTRPLVPMIAGMLALPPYKFAPPNLVACLTWPPIYFFPGVLAGVAIDIPSNANSTLFRELLFGVVILLWLAIWLSWRWVREKQYRADKLTRWLSPVRLRLAAVLSWVGTLVCFYYLQLQPSMPVYRQLLWKVLVGVGS